jgi:hypothetical protein
MNGLIYQIQGFVIDKSTSFQTICQTNKYQTNIGGISPNHVFGYMGYIGYRGYRHIKGLSKYRPIPRISHIETLNVSHSGRGYMAGYIKRYQTISIGHIRHMRDMRIYGLMV